MEAILEECFRDTVRQVDYDANGFCSLIVTKLITFVVT